MISEVRIAARNVELSEPIENSIRKKARKLGLFYDSIIKCRVVVEAPHRRRQKGVLYNVRIDMTVPDRELMVKRESHEDLYVAIRDAFEAARRRLKDHARQQRREVKHRETMPRAQVSALFPEQGYGFLSTPDGNEIYFHRNSVLDNKFQDLKIGTAVRFVESLGEKGAQASTVKVP